MPYGALRERIAAASLGDCTLRSNEKKRRPRAKRGVHAGLMLHAHDSAAFLKKTPEGSPGFAPQVQYIIIAHGTPTSWLTASLSSGDLQVRHACSVAGSGRCTAHGIIKHSRTRWCDRIGVSWTSCIKAPQSAPTVSISSQVSSNAAPGVISPSRLTRTGHD